MVPDAENKVSQNVNELEKVDALTGSPGSDPEKDGLMHSALPHDEEVSEGKLLAESYDYNLNSFQPDLLYEQLCKNYRHAKKLFGQTLIRELTGYDDKFVEKNINIPEFRSEIKQKIHSKVDELKEKKLLDKEGNVTKQGIKLASVIRYTEELERITNKGFGKEERHERGLYGERAEHKNYANERFFDIDLRRSVQKAARRGHSKLIKEDLVVNERHERAKVTIVYAIDASGSMRGNKLGMAKRAGVALAYQAIQDKNEVGVIVFTSKIEKNIAPSRNFLQILEELTVVKAGLETDIALSIEEAVNVLNNTKGTKHLVLLTDALPTKTQEKKTPTKRVLEAVSSARGANITLSLVGISLDEEGEKLARRMSEIGNGKLYLAKNADAIDAIILEDYAQVIRNNY